MTITASQLATWEAEVERLRAEQKLDGAEIERLQRVVADQALTIGTLKDELGATAEALSHERDCSTGLADELMRSEKEAQTARLALDVAMKEVAELRSLLCQHGDGTQPKSDEQDIANLKRWKWRVDQLEAKLKWFEEREPLFRPVVEALRDVIESEFSSTIREHEALAAWERDNPKPGAAT